MPSKSRTLHVTTWTLRSAIRAESDYFVTGDRRDFGHFFETTVHRVTILTPLWLAEVLAEHIQTKENGA